MLKHNELLPEESQEQNKKLFRHLHQIYDTGAKDEVSITNIRQRLLQASSKSLPISTPGSFSDSVQIPLLASNRHEKRVSMQFMHTLQQQKPWQRGLTVIAALILITLLTGSLAIVLTNIHQSQTAHLGIQRHGWVQAASFSGTGNKTIIQRITTGRVTGIWSSCSQQVQDVGTITVTTVDGSSMSGGCSNSGANLDKPSETTITQTLSTVAKIAVSVGPNISWQIIVFKYTYPLLASDGANWKTIVDTWIGVGNGGYQGTFDGAENSRSAPLPQVWKLKFVCYGAGKIQFSFNPEAGVAGFTASCNGKTQVKRFTNNTNQTHKLNSITINAGADSDWQMLIEGCIKTTVTC